MIRLLVLAVAAFVIPTLVWRRVGGKRSSYIALLSGVGMLIAAEVLYLAGGLAPAWVTAEGSLFSPPALQSGGFLLVLLGFLCLMHDVKAMQARDRQVATKARARAEEARLQKAKFQAILNSATDHCIITCDPQGRITSFSDGGTRIFGWEAEEVVGRMTVDDLQTERARVQPDRVVEAIRQQGHYEGELPLVRKDGTEIPVLVNLTPLTASDGTLEGYVGVAHDITALKEAQTALRRERDFVRGIIETNELFIDGISLLDGRITMFNDGAQRITGYRRDEVIGREYVDLFIPEEDRARVRRMLAAGRDRVLPAVDDREQTILTKSGERRLIAWSYNFSLDEHGAPCYMVGFGHDITEERVLQESLEQAKEDLEQANEQLEHLATTDYLTGLVNRRQADLMFQRELARSERNHRPLAVALMDLDHFKTVNDTHGHDVGDACLRHVGEVLRRRMRGSDIVARHGGEEFLLVLPEAGHDQAALLADEVRRRIQRNPLCHDGARIHLSTSVGVAVLEPGQVLSVDELRRRADEAMYCAKNLGGNRVVIWDRMQQGEVGPSLSSSQEVTQLQSRIDTLRNRNRAALLEGMYQLVDELEGQNGYIERHSRNVADYAVAIATEMGLSETQIETVRRSARLHDIGKSAVPAEILWKPEPLSKSDWDLVCQHPAASVKVLERLTFLGRELGIIRHHHERPDGRGYPDGLSGDAIPLEARVVAVADALEAMTRDRPYRDAFSLQEALEQLQDGAPEQLDPKVVAAAMVVAERAGDWPRLPETRPVGVTRDA